MLEKFKKYLCFLSLYLAQKLFRVFKFLTGMQNVVSFGGWLFQFKRFPRPHLETTLINYSTRHTREKSLYTEEDDGAFGLLYECVCVYNHCGECPEAT